jgi:hypothetical protein
MICSVPSRCWEIAKERISSSVITPPALRITCASPIESPRIGYGFRRASIQATIATFLAGGSGRSPLSKPSARPRCSSGTRRWRSFRPPFELGPSKHVKGELVSVFARQYPAPTNSKPRPRRCDRCGPGPDVTAPAVDVPSRWVRFDRPYARIDAEAAARFGGMRCGSSEASLAAGLAWAEASSAEALLAVLTAAAPRPGGAVCTG